MSDVWRADPERDGPAAETTEIDERSIREALDEARMWNDAAWTITSMLPAGPMRLHLEASLHDGGETARAMERAPDHRTRLALARQHRDATFELLQVATSMRKQLIEEPVREAIREAYRCFSRFAGGTQLAVRFADGEVAWTGVVYSFELFSHPRATHAFAWWGMDADGRQSVFTMLALPPFSRPHDAIRAFVTARGSH